MTGLQKILKQKLPAEVYEEVVSALSPEDLDYIPRSRLNEVIIERDTALDNLKAAQTKSIRVEDFEEYKALQQKYNDDIAAKDRAFKEYKDDVTINDKLKERKCKNIVATRALFNVEALKEDLSGLDAEIQRVKSEADYLFGNVDVVDKGTGTNGAGDHKNTEKTTISPEKLLAAMNGR